MECTLKVKPARPGRPVGSTYLTRAVFLKSVPEIYYRVLDTRAEHPTQNDVAVILGIGRSTLNRYLNAYGVTWGQIREQAVEKLLDAGSF